jgi:UDP-N-acetylmuramyl pentapeptide phosphotransferase/UDP-N-acetylglucosamine-1-phosphate transferase
VLILVSIVLLAALISAGLIVLLRPLLRRYALARPNARSSHVTPTPQGAGIAVIAATLVVAGIGAGIGGFGISPALYGATIFMALLGLADDIRSIPVLPRLALQAAGVGALLLVAPANLRLLPELPLAIERTLLLLAGLWFVNLVNFMDGLDLMTVAETVPVSVALFLLGWLGELPPLPTTIAAALCGAMLGFAPFNRPVAKIFLGDVGSLPIGLLLGWCLLQLAWHHHLASALLLPLYYLADATLTLLRRVAMGQPFWVAHRSHFYQCATDNGFAVAQVIVEVFALNVALAVLAIAATSRGSPQTYLLLLGAILVALVLYRFSTKKAS